MKNARKSPWRILYKFHRYAGLLTALILMLLAITGIALNHTHDLQLDKRYIDSAKILDWYGIELPKKITTFKTENHWLTQLYEQLYFDQQLLGKQASELIGAVETDAFVVIATREELMLVSLQGDVVEEIPKKSRRLGKNQPGHIFIHSKDRVMLSDDDLLSWKTSEERGINWSRPTQIANPYQLQIEHHYRSNIIPYERLLLDVHSGRFFGSYGVLVVDIAGIICFFLAVSGCWMWARHKLKQLNSRKINKSN
jgi:hypothetical protein